MYFLEKGNTDTYKKMVEEQYKWMTLTK
jgi:hypothetical protein